MSFILSGLSPGRFKLKEATYCAIVAAIVGHLAFFILQESPTEKNCLEQAAQMYQQDSTHDASVKQAVERIFQPDDHAFLNLFRRSHINHTLLATEAVQAALDNFISTK